MSILRTTHANVLRFYVRDIFTPVLSAVRAAGGRVQSAVVEVCRESLRLQLDTVLFALDLYRKARDDNRLNLLAYGGELQLRKLLLEVVWSIVVNRKREDLETYLPQLRLGDVGSWVESVSTLLRRLDTAIGDFKLSVSSGFQPDLNTTYRILRSARDALIRICGYGPKSIQEWLGLPPVLREWVGDYILQRTRARERQSWSRWKAFLNLSVPDLKLLCTVTCSVVLAERELRDIPASTYEDCARSLIELYQRLENGGLPKSAQRDLEAMLQRHNELTFSFVVAAWERQEFILRSKTSRLSSCFCR